MNKDDWRKANALASLRERWTCSEFFVHDKSPLKSNTANFVPSHTVKIEPLCLKTLPNEVLHEPRSVAVPGCSNARTSKVRRDNI